MTKIRNLRWWIAGLLASGTALSYLDRQSFPVAVTEIQKHIPISNQQYSELQMLFLLAYAVMYAGGGRVADWLGTRAGYSLQMLLWSVATILHGLVSSVMGLGVARFLLGFGEGGGFPCSAKAVSEWFPKEERAFAFGIFNTGSSIGAVAAPPLIALIILTLNWRWVFFLTGVVGFAWALIWWLFYAKPENQKLITDTEREYIQSSLVAANDPQKEHISWARLFQYRQVWALISAKFLTDAAWFFFIFWLPKYLGDVRHLNIKEIGYYAWIPYAFAGAGSFLGGWLSGFLIRHNLSMNASRKVCLGLSAAIMPVSLLIAKSPLQMALGLFSLALFGHQFWATILQTLATDIFPSRVVGTVAGMMGAVGAFGAMLFNLLIGELLSQYKSYSPVFMIAGLVYPVALLLILLIIPRIEMVSSANPHLKLTS